MKKQTSKSQEAGEMAADYDFTAGERGRYAKRMENGSNLVLLTPEVAAAFPTSKAVNDALSMLIRIADSKSKTAPVMPRRHLKS